MATSKPAAPSGEQSIEKLQERFSQLNKRKIQAETNLDHARTQLETLQTEAREKYGTDDLAALREKLAQMKAENEAKRASYQEQLDKIEADLASVDQKFAAENSLSTSQP
jgi:chromosome segregation ATPase